MNGAKHLVRPMTTRALDISLNGGKTFLDARIQRYGETAMNTAVQVLLEGESRLLPGTPDASVALDAGEYHVRNAIYASSGRMLGGTPTVIGQIARNTFSYLMTIGTPGKHLKL